MSNIGKLVAFGPRFWLPGSPTFEQEREVVEDLVRFDIPVLENNYLVLADQAESELLRNSLGNLLWTRNVPDNSSLEVIVDDKSPTALDVVELAKDSIKPIVEAQNVYYSHDGRPELPYTAKLDMFLGSAVPILIARMKDYENPDFELVAFRAATHTEVRHSQGLIDLFDPYARSRAEMGIQSGHMAEVKQFIPRQTSGADQTAS